MRTDPGLTVLAGMPCAGKTTYAFDNFEARAIASYDLAAGQLADCPVGDDSRGLEAHRLLRSIVGCRSALGGTTCIDFTNLLTGERSIWTRMGFLYSLPVHLVAFDTPLWLALWRNRQRVSPLSDEEIRLNHVKSVSMLEAIKQEKWSSVTVLPSQESQEDLISEKCPVCGGELELREDEESKHIYSFQCDHCGVACPLVDPKPKFGVIYGGKEKNGSTLQASTQATPRPSAVSL